MASRAKAITKTVTREDPYSAEHLAKGRLPALSAVEFALTLVSAAYERWAVRCISTVGMPQLSMSEVLILHFVRHRDKPKSFVDIMLVRDIDETHVVTYSVRKLEKLGLVSTKRAGKEKLVQITKAGIDVCDKYGKLREEVLIKTAEAANISAEDLSNTAEMLRVLAGIYSQANRVAATM